MSYVSDRNIFPSERSGRLATGYAEARVFYLTSILIRKTEYSRSDRLRSRDLWNRTTEKE